MELAKVYQPQEYEDDIYQKWLDSGYFNPDNLEGEPFSIMMPPPNVTGVLHLGHALENALMDVVLRYQRLKGKKALLVPGTDHAAVATQAKVEGLLQEQGMENPREELGREGLLEKIREYAEDSKATILKQIKKVGTSCDWSRLAYTFDEKRSGAVNTVFVKMYNDGLIYRGYKVINWTVKGQSTCSDDELEHIDRKAKFYTFKYSKDFPIVIATTRPETKLGDTAVAVNPKDDRYKEYIGQIFTVDIGAEKPLEIKVIADENVDMEMGTGALGVTPAHSAVDFEMYEKQKAQGDAIEIIPVIGPDGKMTKAAGADYAGLDVIEARTKFVDWLKVNDLLIKEEEIDQTVGCSDRYKDVVEALPMTQWFVDVNKIIPGRNKTLKDLLKEAVTIGHNGDKNQKVKITPERFERVYFNWIDNLRDWCISRQIWWGHRIPVYYCDDCGEVIVSGEKIEICEECNSKNIRQEEDTLDTWFSSGLWTFSALGWPEETDDLKTFHPTTWMQMGTELVFFWMARMILMSTYNLDTIPFKDVYIHGLLRDAKGDKFSKSSGNNIDPIGVIEEYGADALRLSLLIGIAPGQDSKYYTEKIESSRNFVNKLWNISRFLLSKIDNVRYIAEKPEAKTLADKWFLAKFDEVKVNYFKQMDNYNISLAGEALREFAGDVFADWYLEIAKVEGGKEEIMLYVWRNLLQLWHPFIPFVTEVLWENLKTDKLLIVSVFEKPEKLDDVEMVYKEFSLLQEIISSIRNIKNEYKVTSRDLLVNYRGENKELLETNKDVIIALSKIKELNFTEKEVEKSVNKVLDGVELFIQLNDLVDPKKEKERLTKEIENFQNLLKAVEGKLNNNEFVANAPEIVVGKEKEKQADYVEKLNKLEEKLESLK